MPLSPHRSLAAVWEHLLGRHDISNILHTITGQHALQATIQDEASRTRNSIQTAVWIKIIFDLQRCYLSGATSGTSQHMPQVLSCLLPLDLLLSSISYIVAMKTRLFPTHATPLMKEHHIETTRLRDVLAQTVLSGLRLLVLRKNDLPVYHMRHLQTTISTAWQNDHLQGVECFIIKHVFAEVIRLVGDLEHVGIYQTERVNARLPTYIAGLYPLEMNPETFVIPLIQGMAEEDDDWIDAYWILYDALWAVEYALVQRYVDLHRHVRIVGSNTDIIEEDEILEQLYHTRTSLIVSIFHVPGPMMPSEASLESLATTLLDWNEDLDSFLSRQDSLLQHRVSLRPAPTRSSAYEKKIAELQPYFHAATTSFAEWLLSQKPLPEQPDLLHTSVATKTFERSINEWVRTMAVANAEIHSQQVGGPDTPIYIVQCPKLHAIPKKYLAYQLRWCDKWAFDSLQGNSPIVNWKEGIQCPSCPDGEKIKCARLIEPFQRLSTSTSDLRGEEHSLGQCSGGDTISYDAASTSAASRSFSDGESFGNSLLGPSTMNVSIPITVSQSGSDLRRSISIHSDPPQYTASPVSPLTTGPSSLQSHSLPDCSISPITPVSPVSDWLNVPIPIAVASRLSVDLPIPINTPGIPESIQEETSISALSSNPSSIGFDATTKEGGKGGVSMTKSKSAGKSFRNSVRRKPSAKDTNPCALPKDPSFVFSTSAQSLLLWENGGSHVVRFDISVADGSEIQSCKYEVEGVEAAAAGHFKCAIIVATNISKKKLLVYHSLNSAPVYQADLEISSRCIKACLAVSRDDRYVVVSLNDHINLFSLENGLKKIPFHHHRHQHADIYELQDATPGCHLVRRRKPSDESTTSSHSAKWFNGHSKSLTTTEVAEEHDRQTALIARKLSFSADSQRLVVATHLGDHYVYIDVWDVTRSPVSSISEAPRSFKLPPWTLNDGDLTSVFFNPTRRCALVTAFLGKEYPLVVPFPGYEALQTETYSTKVVAAALSPSGERFVVANAMTEIVQFEYTTTGAFSPRKLKKGIGKIGSSVFRLGGMAMGMPSEDLVRIFWVKDGKFVLRSVGVGARDGNWDVDLRAWYERVVGGERKMAE